MKARPSKKATSGRRGSPKHGYYNTPVYNAWRNMKQRCFDANVPDFKNYGARGITVCERWRVSFEAFLADMGDRPDGMTLDRIDVNGNYEPGNCRWATQATQVRNRRATRINEEVADEIRARRARGEGRAVIAASLGVSRDIVTNVTSGRNWRAA